MRLIDADELKAQILETIKVYKTNGYFDEPLARFCKMLREEVKAIASAPTIDAEPVLHCKDCKHWHNGVNITYCYKLSLAMIKENDYCSFGERREP